MSEGQQGIYPVGFPGTTVAVRYNNEAARELIHFLFHDLPACGSPLASRSFDVIFSGHPTQISLWQDEKQLYFGSSRYDLAVILANEVLHECVTGNHTHHALHAAALVCSNRTILLPGTSGSGKSSLAAWLALQGCSYLSDELILLSDEGKITPFTRPLSLRPQTVAALDDLLSDPGDQALRGENGALIAHRRLNPIWKGDCPPPAVMVFPTFLAGSPAILTPITPARACMQLMACHVTARNFRDHGLQAMSRLVRGLSLYSLTFGGFSDLRSALAPLLDSQHEKY